MQVYLIFWIGEMDKSYYLPSQISKLY